MLKKMFYISFYQLYLIRIFQLLSFVTIKKALHVIIDKPQSNSAGAGLITLGERRLSKVIFKNIYYLYSHASVTEIGWWR